MLTSGRLIQESKLNDGSSLEEVVDKLLLTGAKELSDLLKMAPSDEAVIPVIRFVSNNYQELIAGLVEFNDPKDEGLFGVANGMSRSNVIEVASIPVGESEGVSFKYNELERIADGIRTLGYQPVLAIINPNPSVETTASDYRILALAAQRIGDGKNPVMRLSVPAGLI